MWSRSVLVPLLEKKTRVKPIDFFNFFGLLSNNAKTVYDLKKIFILCLEVINSLILARTFNSF